MASLQRNTYRHDVDDTNYSDDDGEESNWDKIVYQGDENFAKTLHSKTSKEKANKDPKSSAGLDQAQIAIGYKDVSKLCFCCTIQHRMDNP